MVVVHVTEDATSAEFPPATALLHHLAEDLDAGFAEVVRTHQHILYSTALRVGGVRPEAEDLVSEALLRAYRALRGYDRSRILKLQLRPWLLTILLNTWRNSLRDASRRPGEAPLSELVEPAMPGPGLDELAVHAETRRRLGELLAELSPAQRSAVVLRHVIGLSTAEVASILECPEGTVKSHISRGLRRLSSLWKEP